MAVMGTQAWVLLAWGSKGSPGRLEKLEGLPQKTAVLGRSLGMNTVRKEAWTPMLRTQDR